jgi:hypothetical protein
MDDYISREAAYQFFKDQLEEETGAYRKGRNAGLRVAMSAVMNNDAIPAADVRPVVLCRDCYAYRRDKELAEAAYLDPEMYCGLLRCEMGEDSFCSYGKRKEET